MNDKTVTLLALGSRGQVQPYVALGKGLKKAGISVRLATSSNYEPFVIEHGFEFHRLTNVDAREIAKSDEGRAIIASKNPLKLLPGLLNLIRPHFKELIDGMFSALDEASVGIFNPLTQFGGYDVCERLGISPIFSYVQSVIPMKELPSPFTPPIPPIPGQAIYNRLTHHAMIQIAWQLFRPLVNDVRVNRLRLPKSPLRGNWHKIKREKVPVLLGFSPHIIPPSTDWDENIHVTGYWFVDEPAAWSAPPKLEQFLANGEPPVFIGFGSTSNDNPEKITRIIVDALIESGNRGLLLTGWGGLHNAELPENIFQISSCPFSWLLPRMKAIVHHGGAGTAADGFRAGKPQITIPTFSDQPFWGRMIYQHGVGPKPLPNKKITTRLLTSTINQVDNDHEMQRRAAIVGKRIRADNGVGRAVEVIKHVLSAQ